jgi:hypothetical protein
MVNREGEGRANYPASHLCPISYKSPGKKNVFRIAKEIPSKQSI